MAVDRKTPTTVNYAPTIGGSTYADLVNEEVDALWERAVCYLTSVGGTANAITASASPALDAYRKGQSYYLVPTLTNLGAATINIDGKGLRDIKLNNGNALSGGELVAGQQAHLVDNGTQLRIQSGAATATASLQAPMLLASYRQPQGTNGGAITADARQKYPLNNLTINEIVGASLGSNQVTLPAGTYEVEAACTFTNSDAVLILLRNATLGSDITTIARSGIFSDQAAMPTLSGKFTIASSSVIELQYYANTNNGVTTLGFPINASGIAEEYGWIRFRKVA